MRRALILIITLTVLSVGSGAYLDRLRYLTAEDYLRQLEEIRQLLLTGDISAAQREEAHLHARWQHDSQWLKCLISHHHIRDVNAALLHLVTALEQHWPDEALLAIGEASEALEDVRTGHLATLVNIV